MQLLDGPFLGHLLVFETHPKVLLAVAGRSDGEFAHGSTLPVGASCPQWADVQSSAAEVATCPRPKP